MAKFAQHLFTVEKHRSEYEDTCKQRLLDYAAHMETMEIPPELDAWAQKMVDKETVHAVGQAAIAGESGAVLKAIADKCRTIGVWCVRVPPLTALMIVRYGEAVESGNLPGGKWPRKFTGADISRAYSWLESTSIPDPVVEANKHGV